MGKKLLRRLISVYDADGGLLGEIAFLTGRLLGRVQCALCEITHGAAGEKPAFRRLRRSLGVEVATLHRNEQPPPMRVVTEGLTPCIVAETAAGYEVLLARTDLEACHGDVVRLDGLLRRALEGD